MARVGSASDYNHRDSGPPLCCCVLIIGGPPSRRPAVRPLPQQPTETRPTRYYMRFHTLTFCRYNFPYW